MKTYKTQKEFEAEIKQQTLVKQIVKGDTIAVKRSE